MTSVAIRIATPEDADVLSGIYRYYVEDTAVTFETEAPTPEDFRSRIGRTLARYPWLVAEVDGNVVGYAYAGPFKMRSAYDRSVEVSVYLHRDERGRGVGRMLYDELEAILRKQGILNLNACIASTDDAADPYLTTGSIRFHERMGYKLVGVFHCCGYKHGRWYSATWMEKMLGEHGESPAPFVPFADMWCGN